MLGNFVINELTYPLRNNQLHLAMNIALSLNHKPDPGSIHKDPHHIYHIPLLLLLEQILDNFMKKGKIINRGNSWHWANFEFGLRFEISWMLHIMVCLYKNRVKNDRNYVLKFILYYLVLREFSTKNKRKSQNIFEGVHKSLGQ